MFVEYAVARALALGQNIATAANFILTRSRPYQIVDFMEAYWRQAIASAGFAGTPAAVGVPGVAIGVDGVVARHRAHGRTQPIEVPLLAVPGIALEWHHLVYAFMLENTRMYDIFRRVVYEYVHGERLPNPTHQTQRWLRNTEELFFSSPRVLSVRGLSSNLRPDDSAIRRNLYFRALGMDLTHGAEDGRPYPYVKSDSANRDFVVVFETLLREVWRGYINRNAALSTNDSDNNAIATLVRRIYEMLMARRFSGRLSREEFDAVATLSWFRLVIYANTAIVNNLSVQAAGEADRLKRIGELVGLSAHSRADAYIQLAQPMSFILREIENGNVARALIANPADLYDDLSAYQAPMLDIITHWSIATGRTLKDISMKEATLGVLTDSSRYPGAASTNGRQTNGVGAGRIPASAMRHV